MYAVLYEEFFQRYIPKDLTVLEIGAGYCELINSIKAKKKIALDVNPDARKYARDDVQIITNKSTHMDSIKDASVDLVIANNFFEHITKPDIVETLQELHRILKMGGGS